LEPYIPERRSFKQPTNTGTKVVKNNESITKNISVKVEATLVAKKRSANIKDYVSPVKN
jgi:ABC-type polysaccharide/polyol phosphate export permease